MITKPGVYDLPAEVYHADPLPAPSLSSSIAKVLLDQSPLHAWFAHPRLNPAWEQENREEFNLGSACHDLILRGQDCLAVIDVATYATKAAREARDAAYAEGKTPLKKGQWEDVQLMAKAVRMQLELHREASDAFTDGKPEQTMVWQEGPVWCRSRLDWLPNDGEIFYDLKTTTDSSPEAWQRRLFENGADVQSGFYRRGIRAVLKIEQPRFRFVVVENVPPYAMCVMELDPAAIDLADQKVEAAIQIWGECMKDDRWPGYAPMVHHVGPPAWQLTKWEDRKYRRQITDEVFLEHYAV